MDKAIAPEPSAGGQKRREGHRLEETERRLEAEEVLNLHKLKNCGACKLKSKYPRFTNSCGSILGPVVILLAFLLVLTDPSAPGWTVIAAFGVTFVSEKVLHQLHNAYHSVI